MTSVWRVQAEENYLLLTLRTPYTLIPVRVKGVNILQKQRCRHNDNCPLPLDHPHGQLARHPRGSKWLQILEVVDLRMTFGARLRVELEVRGGEKSST